MCVLVSFCTHRAWVFFFVYLFKNVFMSHLFSISFLHLPLAAYMYGHEHRLQVHGCVCVCVNVFRFNYDIGDYFVLSTLWYVSLSWADHS